MQARLTLDQDVITYSTTSNGLSHCEMQLFHFSWYDMHLRHFIVAPIPLPASASRHPYVPSTIYFSASSSVFVKCNEAQLLLGYPGIHRLRAVPYNSFKQPSFC